MQQYTLENKTILITGASSGIGKGIALACAEAGATCILVARNIERLKETQAQCGGENHQIHSMDLGQTGGLSAFVDHMPELDGLVLCAGIGDNQTPLKFITDEFFDKMIGVNVKAPVLLLALCAKKKKLKKGASVVAISSIASFHATIAHSMYCACKGALTAFVKGAALDLAPRKIRVNSIAPGMINTPLIDFTRLTEEQRALNESKYPLKRYGEPSDVAGAAVYLLSDTASWVTGQQFVIDGGLTIGG